MSDGWEKNKSFAAVADLIHFVKLPESNKSRHLHAAKSLEKDKNLILQEIHRLNNPKRHNWNPPDTCHCVVTQTFGRWVKKKKESWVLFKWKLVDNATVTFKSTKVTVAVGIGKQCTLRQSRVPLICMCVYCNVGVWEEVVRAEMEAENHWNAETWKLKLDWVRHVIAAKFTSRCPHGYKN